jgi:hypothetical protein
MNIIMPDLSGGSALQPIRVVNNVDDDLVPVEFTYIDRNVDVDTDETDCAGCKCVGRCDSNTCICYKKSTIRLDENGQVKNVTEQEFYDDDLYECSEICKCKADCGNRMNRPANNKFNLKVEVFKTEKAGWAVRSLQYIEKGTFVAEFVGEMISKDETSRRQQEYAFHVNSRTNAEYFIDPQHYGNISRFFNHSCFCNMKPIRFYSLHRNHHRPSIGFVAWRAIVPGDELTIDYGTEWWQEKIEADETFFCQCSAPFCCYPEPEREDMSEDEAEEEIKRILTTNHKRLEIHKRIQLAKQMSP